MKKLLIHNFKTIERHWVKLIDFGLKKSSENISVLATRLSISAKLQIIKRSPSNRAELELKNA